MRKLRFRNFHYVWRARNGPDSQVESCRLSPLKGSSSLPSTTCTPFSAFLQGIPWLLWEHPTPRTKTLSATQEPSSRWWGAVTKKSLSSVSRKDRQPNGQPGWEKSATNHSLLREFTEVVRYHLGAWKGSGGHVLKGRPPLCPSNPWRKLQSFPLRHLVFSRSVAPHPLQPFLIRLSFQTPSVCWLPL